MRAICYTLIIFLDICDLVALNNVNRVSGFMRGGCFILIVFMDYVRWLH